MQLKISLLPFLFVLGACASGSDTIDEPLPPSLSESEKRHIYAAREERDRARDALAAASADIENAKDALRLAQRDLDVMTDKVENAENLERWARVQRTENVAEIERAKRTLEQTKAERTATLRRIDMREQQVACAHAVAEVRQQQLRLADARARFATAEVMDKLDRPDVKKPNLPRVQEEVRRAEAEVNIAQVKADAARREVDVAEANFQKSAKDVPAELRK